LQGAFCCSDQNVLVFCCARDRNLKTAPIVPETGSRTQAKRVISCRKFNFKLAGQLPLLVAGKSVSEPVDPVPWSFRVVGRSESGAFPPVGAVSCSIAAGKLSVTLEMPPSRCAAI